MAWANWTVAALTCLVIVALIGRRETLNVLILAAGVTLLVIAPCAAVPALARLSGIGIGAAWGMIALASAGGLALLIVGWRVRMVGWLAWALAVGLWGLAWLGATRDWGMGPLGASLLLAWPPILIVWSEVAALQMKRRAPVPASSPPRWRIPPMPLNDLQKAEVESVRAQSSQTYRETAHGLEEILYQPIPVLDHGFVRVIDYMGTDSAIVQAARVSYGKGTKKVSEDSGLIRYLLRHRHTTPFEMCELKLHIKLPIFVARQWIRHRTANVNEYSGRYSIMDREFYIPSPEHLAAQSSSNRQGRGDVLEGEEAQEVLQILKEDSTRAYAHYEQMMNCNEEGNVFDENRQGLARELARMNLPVNFYTQWYWKVDLHNLMSFLALRADSHAQYEIRAYADVMIDILKHWLPITHQAFVDYRMGAMELSAPALAVLRRMLKGEKVEQEGSGLSKREWDELIQVLAAE